MVEDLAFCVVDVCLTYETKSSMNFLFEGKSAFTTESDLFLRSYREALF